MTDRAPNGLLGGKLTRRGFLVGLGGTAALIAARGGPRLRAVVFPAAAQASGPAVRTVGVLRREDMLNATLYFYDVEFSDAPFGIELFGPGGGFFGKPTVVVELPPQSIGEEVFLNSAPPGAGTMARAVLAHPSRIAFPVDGVETFSAEELFAWDERELRRTPTTNPSSIETSVEVPWAIELSPQPGNAGRDARFIARPPLTKDGITGLWTAELARTVDGDVIDLSNPPPVNVVDVDTVEPFPLHAITGQQRENIETSTQEEAPVDVNHLVLTPLGAWADMQGDWSGDLPGGLTHWRQRSTMGRDHFVRIIEKGFLFPFGHRAVEIDVTERKILPDNRAYLLKRKYIVVKQPVISYDDQPLKERYAGRAWPFRKVEMLTLTTPDLLVEKGKVKRESLQYANEPRTKNDDPFWVQTPNRSDVRFSVRATDWDGNEVEFSLPMIFAKVSNRERNGIPLTYRPESWAPIVEKYNGLGIGTSAKAQRSVIRLSGQKVALAPSETDDTGPQADAAGYATSSVVLKSTTRFAVSSGLSPDVVAGLLSAFGMGGFRPEVGQVEVRIDQAETITQTAVPKPKVVLNQSYLDLGYGPENVKGVFADLVEEIPLPFPADKAGALLTPNIAIKGLVRDLGPVGDVATFLGVVPEFDPKKYFPSDPLSLLPLPKLLGGIELPDVIATSGPDNAPRMTTTAIYPDNDKKRPPKAIDTRLDWTPVVTNFVFTGDPPAVGEPIPDDANGFFVLGDPVTALEIHGTFLTTFEQGVQMTSFVTGDLRDFAVAVGPIRIDFTKLSFVSRNGVKPEVDVQVADVKLRSPLTFVNEFAALMSKTAGENGLAIDVSAQGVKANYTLAIPDINIGVFAMRNMTMYTGIDIPFKGDDPALVYFNFCSKDDPFLLTVYGFGGSGYFGIELTPKGVQTLTASLGFGAAVSMSFPPIASGSARIHAGINFILESSPDNADETKVTIGGFLSLFGSLQVTVVSVSISLYLTFEYVNNAGSEKVRASGVLTIEVDLVLVSKTITKTVEYSFGDGADPTVADAFTEQDWIDYAGAFAPAS